MYQTYELYLREMVDGPPRFEPLTCRTPTQLMDRVRDLLRAQANLASVEVRVGGQHLFTVER